MYNGIHAFLCAAYSTDGETKYLIIKTLNVIFKAVESIKSHPVEKQAYRNESVRDRLYNIPWHLGKRNDGMTGLYMAPHHLSKRDPSADPGGVSLSVTANMDTLRQRLLWSLQNNHRQVSIRVNCIFV